MRFDEKHFQESLFQLRRTAEQLLRKTGQGRARTAPSPGIREKKISRPYCPLQEPP